MSANRYNRGYHIEILIFEWNIDNIICLPGRPGDVLHPFRVLRKGVVLMSTYEEFMVILTVALLIVAILNMKNKK